MNAAETDSSRSAMVQEAIHPYPEDSEDLKLAKQAEADTQGSKPLRQVRKDLDPDRSNQ